MRELSTSLATNADAELGRLNRVSEAHDAEIRSLRHVPSDAPGERVARVVASPAGSGVVAFYRVMIVEVGGAEAEGGVPTFTDVVEVLAANVGTVKPPVGAYVILSAGERLVFRYG